MLIYTEKITPRLKYVLNFIFRDVFHVEASLVDEPGDFSRMDGPRINYSSGDMKEGFRLPVSGLMASGGVENIEIGLKTGESYPVLFHTERQSGENEQDPKSYGLDFDVFAAVFYMISRYEEYMDFDPDPHGRFTAGSSTAQEGGFLEIPVVDFWIRELGEALQKQFPEFQIPEAVFRFLPTVDIDIPYAYLHRGWLRKLGARFRAELKGLDDLEKRKAVLRGEEKDPFDTYKEIEAIHALHNIRPGIFFLTSRYGKFDTSISPESKAFKELVKQVQSFADPGIHPSYRASDDINLLRKELAALAKISGSEITLSRQHYLKFRLPGSYRNYLQAGINEEYSMGFASKAGFRAGTAKPFLFYDLLEEEETELKLIPFQVMDRSLKDYMKLSPNQALDKILEIAGAVRETGGIFVSIWHNDAFSDYGEWKGWKDVYLQTINTLANW